ncbi:hypothetical protein D9613_001465 [Agrocybe pediades]|uniref:Uncharacterized protein n=1 Tax=Agrocybe pediades TaxID=84607 RepID=A0A8H4R621_9AGAR|nr:hypothetical protein D9613_001465 [Agrocybe pediades]
MKPLRNARLLEYDQRFSILSPRQFFPYDMNEPDVFPEELRKNVDIAVVDPPFLNEDTHTKVLQTIRQILHPKSKLVLLTSTSIEDIILRLYDEPPLGPLRRTGLTVEHGRLANDFACWASWEGAEEFGVQSKEKGVEEGEKKKEQK